MNIVILGLSITSSWGNGHATTYRALVRELKAQPVTRQAPGTPPEAQLEWVDAGHWITEERPREVAGSVGRFPAQ